MTTVSEMKIHPFAAVSPKSRNKTIWIQRSPSWPPHCSAPGALHCPIPTLFPSSRSGSQALPWHMQPPCPLGSQPTPPAPANYKKQHMAGSLTADPASSPDVQPNRRGRLPRWAAGIKEVSLENDLYPSALMRTHTRGLPITQLTAAALLPPAASCSTFSSSVRLAGGSVACFLSFLWPPPAWGGNQTRTPSRNVPWFRWMNPTWLRWKTRNSR